MKGANAEPSAKIINAPKIAKKKIMGISHHFFLVLIKSHNSFKIESLLILFTHMFKIVFQYH